MPFHPQPIPLRHVWLSDHLDHIKKPVSVSSPVCVQLRFRQVSVPLRFYLFLVGDVFEGFLHQAMKSLSLVKGHNEAVVDSQNRDFLLNKPLDDVLAHLGVEAHQTQTRTAADQVTDLCVTIFDAVK